MGKCRVPAGKVIGLAVGVPQDIYKVTFCSIFISDNFTLAKRDINNNYLLQKLPTNINTNVNS